MTTFNVPSSFVAADAPTPSHVMNPGRYGYRPGVIAQVPGEELFASPDIAPRPCWKVRYPDGVIDCMPQADRGAFAFGTPNALRLQGGTM